MHENIIWLRLLESLKKLWNWFFGVVETKWVHHKKSNDKMLLTSSSFRFWWIDVSFAIISLFLIHFFNPFIYWKWNLTITRQKLPVQIQSRYFACILWGLSSESFVRLPCQVLKKASDISFKLSQMAVGFSGCVEDQLVAFLLVSALSSGCCLFDTFAVSIRNSFSFINNIINCLNSNNRLFKT